MPLISVVSPVYRAEGCVAELCRRLIGVLGTITDDFEIVLVEDHGPDGSWGEIVRQAQMDSRVRGILLSRNFGQHYAITAGLDACGGDWVVVMDCDLQDPPEQIPALYAKALEGFDVVVAAFEERTERPMRQLISRSFWRALSWLAGTSFDPRIGNFRIMSRRVVIHFRAFRERLRLMGGIVSLIGLPTASVSMTRADRYAGQTAYDMRKLLAAASEIVMAYSDKPLKLSIMIGIVMALTSFLVGAVIVILSVMGTITVEGWASVMVSLFFIGGMIIANLGIIGHYLGRTFEETKRRPLYIIQQTTFDPARSPLPSEHQ